MKLSRFVLWRCSILTGYVPRLSERGVQKEDNVGHNLGREYEELVNLEEMLEALEDIQKDLNTFRHDDMLADAKHLLYASRVKMLAVAARRRQALKMLSKDDDLAAELPF